MKSFPLFHWKMIFVVWIGILLLAACQVAGQKSIQLTKADAGKTINLKTGDLVQIVLEGNPTTGFNWEPEALSENSVVKLVGEPQFQSDRNLAGSGGKITLSFQAVQVGEMDLKLIYHRAWEKGVPPIDIYQIKIIVAK